MTITPRIRFRLLRWVAIVCLPLTLFSGLMLLNVVNPMGLAFLTSFTVDNQSGEPVWVTPVGTIGKEGTRSALPLSASSFLCLPALSASRFPLNAGERVKLTYDWDDIQFSELVIAPASGPARMLVVDETPAERQYRRVWTNYFMIPKLADLPEAQSGLLLAVDQTSRAPLFWLVALGGLVPPLVIWQCGRRLKSLATFTVPS